jgi:hypothetical protein
VSARVDEGQRRMTAAMTAPTLSARDSGFRTTPSGAWPHRIV